MKFSNPNFASLLSKKEINKPTTSQQFSASNYQISDTFYGIHLFFSKQIFRFCFPQKKREIYRHNIQMNDTEEKF
jgi:hypothetical protein